jgi:hypothetical protein
MAQGLALPLLVQQVVKERISVSTSELSPVERAAAWRSSVNGLPLSRRFPTPSAATASMARTAK